MELPSKESLVDLVQVIKDSAILVAALGAMALVAVFGTAVYYCWNQWIVRVIHLFHY